MDYHFALGLIAVDDHDNNNNNNSSNYT